MCCDWNNSIAWRLRTNFHEESSAIALPKKCQTCSRYFCQSIDVFICLMLIHGTTVAVCLLFSGRILCVCVLFHSLSHSGQKWFYVSKENKRLFVSRRKGEARGFVVGYIVRSLSWNERERERSIKQGRAPFFPCSNVASGGQNRYYGPGLDWKCYPPPFCVQGILQ